MLARSYRGHARGPEDEGGEPRSAPRAGGLDAKALACRIEGAVRAAYQERADGGGHVTIRLLSVDAWPLETPTCERRSFLVVVTASRGARAPDRPATSAPRATSTTGATSATTSTTGATSATSATRLESVEAYAKRARTPLPREEPMTTTYSIYVRFGYRRLVLKRRIASREAARAALQALRADRFHHPEHVFLVEDATGRVLDEPDADEPDADASHTDAAQ